MFWNVAHRQDRKDCILVVFIGMSIVTWFRLEKSWKWPSTLFYFLCNNTWHWKC